MWWDLIWFESDIVFDFDGRCEILDEVWTLAPEEDPGCWHKPFARIKQLTRPQLQAVFTKVPPNNKKLETFTAQSNRKVDRQIKSTQPQSHPTV